MRSWQIVAVTAIAFGSGVAMAPRGPAGDDVLPMTTAGAMIERLRSNDPQTRCDARMELDAFHRELTDGLLQIAGTRKPPEASENSRHLAVELLPKFYAPQAIPLLVKHVDYQQSMTRDALSPLNGYPCAMALETFGQGATAAILAHLCNTKTEEVSSKANELYAWLFIGAYGPPVELGGRITGGPDEAIRVIESARDRFQGPGQQNCQQLLDMFKHFAKGRYPRWSESETD